VCGWDSLDCTKSTEEVEGQWLCQHAWPPL